MKLKSTKHIEVCTIAKDYQEITEEQQLWREQREVKSRIFHKYDELILILEESLPIFTNPVERKHVCKQIKKLKKIRKMYDLPAILSTRLEIYDQEKPVLKVKKR